MKTNSWADMTEKDYMAMRLREIGLAEEVIDNLVKRILECLRTTDQQ